MAQKADVVASARSAKVFPPLDSSSRVAACLVGDKIWTTLHARTVAHPAAGWQGIQGARYRQRCCRRYRGPFSLVRR